MKYSIKIAENICDLLIEGKSLNSICKQDGFPNIRDVWNWLDFSPEFKKNYIEARKIQAHTLADSILDIADEGGDVQRNKLRVDARKWMASKMLPKVYSDRQMIVGDDDSDAVKIDISTRDRAKALASLLSKIKKDD